MLAKYALLASLALAACGSRHEALDATVAAHDAALREMPRAFYVPGLGDQMHALQLRHSKLWFAGTARNWPLAAFELEEIGETLDRVGRWHADSEDLPVAASIKAHMQRGRYAVDQSIRRGDGPGFERAYDQLTEGCNGCHRAAKHGFIVIQRPSSEPVGNQRWAAD